MPEWAELWRKTGQRGLLIASYKRLEKIVWKGHNSCGRGSSCPCTLGAAQGPCRPSSCAAFTLNSSWGRAATGKKSLASLHAGLLPLCLTLCSTIDWPAKLLCQGWGFSRQEYWSVFVNTAGHTLLKYCISCCPRLQLPWVSGAARTPVTQAAAPSPHLALIGANPSPPGQPQEQTPVDNPHAEVEINPQLKPRGGVAEEEDPKPSHQLYRLQIKSARSPGRLCVYGIDKRTRSAPSGENTRVLMAVDIGGKNTEDQNQIRIWAAPTTGPEICTVL